MWIARDKDGRLRLFYGLEPIKGETSWIDTEGQNMELPYYILPEIKWEDDISADVIVRNAEDRKSDEEFDEAFERFSTALLKSLP